MRKVAFMTLGCKVNQYETESMTELFLHKGYETVDFTEFADVYVINTCTVTSLSDRKSRQMIRQAARRNPNAVIAAVGCYSQISPEEVKAIPEVNLISGTKDKALIAERVEDLLKSRKNLSLIDDFERSEDFEEMMINDYQTKTRAFIKVQDGCNRYCSYCIIPYARGPIRSRNCGNIINEITELAKKGFKEVVLTGIHLASYGAERAPEQNGAGIPGIKTGLIDLIKSVHEIKGIERIRLGSIEPTTINDEFLEAAKNLPKLCPQFHISLQSGCDETLKRMNRKYTAEFYKKAVDALRKGMPDVSVTTDVMVGFPGESDEEFKKSYDFLKELKLTKMHVFKYSRRKGTPAADYPDQIAPEIKEARSSRLIEMSDSCQKKFHDSFVGRTMPVLFEQSVHGKPGKYEGLTENHIRIIVDANEDLKGKIIRVKLEKAFADCITGHIEA